jgi:hypothetical protein
VLLKTVQSCNTMPPKSAATASAPDYEFVTKLINLDFHATERTRMMARLLDNQPLDVWMTFQLMEAALVWVRDKKPLNIDITISDTVQTRDQASSTSAKLLQLQDKPVDSFFNFQSIRFRGGGAPVVRHQTRPDGMFLLDLNASTGQEDMVVFYEGDVHGKDAGKTQDRGCKNSQKMYQAIAQAQAKNERVAGCAIFAAMKDAPTDQTLVFLDDMLKAHIFVSIAITDWNSKVQAVARKPTLISSLFGDVLHSKTKYDFIFGINIGIASGDPSYNETDFSDKLNKMLQRLQIVNCQINITQDLKKVAVFHQKKTRIGCVRIVIFAIPRPDHNILALNPTINKPMFLYPIHVSKRVSFNGAVGTAIANNPNAFADILTPAGAAVLGPYAFRKNMMSITAVYDQNMPPQGNNCLLSETNGFFYVALPIAYYTIQQFEFVNNVFDYMWAPIRHDFRQMLRVYKANKKNLTGDLNVTMFMQSKGSLFQTICKSVDRTPPLDDDFKFFLRECCRWNERQGGASYASPQIIFRTLGIFSLQNAIDFACEMRANPNKTYSSLLASYPVGSQLLIQQCMKKLSCNEAYAYIGRYDDRNATIADAKEQVDSDDEDANAQDPIVKNFLDWEKSVRTRFYHSLWTVSVSDDAEAVDTELGRKLLTEYQKTVVNWDIEAISDEAFNDDQLEKDGELLQRLTVVMLQVQLTPTSQGGEGTYQCKLSIPNNLYEPEKSYHIRCNILGQNQMQVYKFTPVCDKEFKFPSEVEDVQDAIGTQYTQKWGSKTVVFTLKSKGFTDLMLRQTFAGVRDFMQSTNDYLMKVGNEDLTYERVQAEMNAVQQPQNGPGTNAQADADNGVMSYDELQDEAGVDL